MFTLPLWKLTQKVWPLTFERENKIWKGLQKIWKSPWMIKETATSSEMASSPALCNKWCTLEFNAFSYTWLRRSIVCSSNPDYIIQLVIASFFNFVCIFQFSDGMNSVIFRHEGTHSVCSIKPYPSYFEITNAFRTSSKMWTTFYCLNGEWKQFVKGFTKVHVFILRR